MSEQSGKFDFCPKCGALARDGECQSCGHHKKKSTPKDKNTDRYASSANLQQYMYSDLEMNQDYAEQYKQYEETRRDFNRGYSKNQGYNTNQEYGKYQGHKENNTYIPNNIGNNPVKKSNTNAIAAITIGVTLLVLFVIVLVVFGFFFFYTVKEDSSVQTYETNESSTSDVFEGEGDRGKEDNLEPGIKEDGEDPFLKSDYVNRWGTNHKNHRKSEFKGDYYENIYECIDVNVDYKINRNFYDYKSANNNIVIRVAYYQLEGEIPNIDTLNEDILAYTAYMAENYFENYPNGSDYEGLLEINTDSYITFNDDKIMSIVLDEQWVVDNDTGFNLYGINMDLQNGVLLENENILDIDENFGKVFREKNKLQNGDFAKILEANEIPDQDIADSIKNAATGILFYTPLGMEVGYNYTYNDYRGWATVTFKDYPNYLKSL